SVAPSQRQQGVATAMLRSALIKCREFKIPKVMLICDSDNVGSRRVIEANNGILQREENGQRWYWIEL
ncbi:MAG: GNAT family N-acetyltransferase, partial [Actinomycetota bacterium]